MDVFFYEAFEEEADSLRRQLGKTLSFAMTSQTIQETGHADPPAKLISIRTQSIIPLEWSAKIDGILSRSTGYDHLKAYRAAIQRPLPCGYLEEYATRAVAEHAILLLMSLLRKLPRQTRQFNSFERDGLTGTECAGKNLLVVGVGRIGSEIARIGIGLGMSVRGVDLSSRYDFLDYVECEQGIAEADAIICAMNLTQENRGYFSYSRLCHAKPSAVFVNIARGEQSPTADLLTLLEGNRLGGVGLDVYADEPNVAIALRNNPLKREKDGSISQGISESDSRVQEIRQLLMFPNVILTPHNAFNTMEAVERKSKFTAEQVEYFLQHKRFKWKI